MTSALLIDMTVRHGPLSSTILFNQAHRSGGIECKGLEIQPIRGKELECVNQSEPSSRHATRGIKGVRLHFS